MSGRRGTRQPAAAPVLSRTVTIPNRRGLHARAAAKFVTMAERFGAAVEVLTRRADPSRPARSWG